MTYEVSYEFPLGSGKVVRRNVTANSVEHALQVAGVKNPTLTARISPDEINRAHAEALKEEVQRHATQQQALREISRAYAATLKENDRIAKELAAQQKSRQLHQIGVAYGPALATKLQETGDDYTLYIQCEPDSEVDATAWAASIGFPIPDDCITIHDKAWSFEARFVGPNYNIPCEWDFVNEGDQCGAHGEFPVGILAGKNVKFNWKEIVEELLKAGITWRAPKRRMTEQK